MTVWSVKEIDSKDAVLLVRTAVFTQGRKLTRLFNDQKLLDVFLRKRIFFERNFCPLTIALTEIMEVTPSELAALGLAIRGEGKAFLLGATEVRELKATPTIIPASAAGGGRFREYIQYDYKIEAATAILANGELVDIDIDRRERQWHSRRLETRRVFRWLKQNISGLGIHNCKLALDALKSVDVPEPPLGGTDVREILFWVTPKQAAELGAAVSNENMFLLIFVAQMVAPQLEPPLRFELVTDDASAIPFDLPKGVDVGNITALPPCYLLYDAYLVSDQPLSVAN